MSGAAHLVVPPDTLVDVATHDRLRTQLAAAPTSTSGIIAPRAAIPPGSSYRAHAERLSLDTARAVESGRQSTDGAVLLRADVGHTVRDGFIHVDEGTLRIDQGSLTHDPWADLGELAVASPLSRPPFPRRPLVLLIGCDHDLDLADWARSIVNDLIRTEIEGRLALPDMPEGLNLTRPCLPDAESIHALDPDVVITLDPVAHGKVEAWCDHARSMIEIEFVDDPGFDCELASWRLGEATGRLRARIGDSANIRELATLISRLCAGPHPLPPGRTITDAPADSHVALRARQAERSVGPGRSVGALVGAEGPARRRVEAFVDRMDAVGVTTHVLAPDTEPSDATRSADLVVVSWDTATELALPLIDRRRAAGLTTVIDIAGALAAGPGDDLTATLDDGVAAMVATSGMATFESSSEAHCLARVRAQTLDAPTLISRDRVDQLVTTRKAASPAPRRKIGLWLDGGTASVPPLVVELLEQRPDLEIAVVGDPNRLHDELTTHERVETGHGFPPPHDAHGWAAQLWAPSARQSTSCVEWLATTGLLGIPTVLLPDHEAGREDLPHRLLRLVAEDPPPTWSEWLNDLLDDDEFQVDQAGSAVRRADAAIGRSVSEIVVGRLLSWSLHPVPTS